MCTISFNSPKHPVSEIQLSSVFTNMITSVQSIEVICISSYRWEISTPEPMFLSMSSYSFSRMSRVFIFSFICFHFAAVMSTFSFFFKLTLISNVQSGAVRYSSLSLVKNMDYSIFGNNSFAMSCAFLLLFLNFIFDCTA